jgi:chromate transport protein ChrA
MYGLSLGVSRIGDTLPPPVYALLSGLNAATVGIIALAAVQLAQKAITDKVTRALVFLGGVAGMLYTALWFFPVLMVGAGIVTIVWDFRWLQRIYKRVRNQRRTSAQSTREDIEPRQRPSDEMPEDASAPYGEPDRDERSIHLRRMPVAEDRAGSTELEAPRYNIETARTLGVPQSPNRIVPPNLQLDLITWKNGLYVIGAFLVSFITIMVIRGQLENPPRGVSLFANLYLAGTIIFGSGPVVIPLLREYIVAEGWVSPRDFLLGLALIQSFPGPNFNFAVYLGSLATARTSLPSFLGALIGFIGIFTPGILIVIGIMGLWSVLRTHRWLLSLLRGVNAGAVGLVFTAVYKLWQIGYVDVDNQGGSPLGRDPWWVTITATSFVGGAWFGLSAPFAILLGGVMGMAWYGVVKV